MQVYQALDPSGEVSDHSIRCRSPEESNGNTARPKPESGAITCALRPAGRTAPVGEQHPPTRIEHQDRVGGFREEVADDLQG